MSWPANDWAIRFKPLLDREVLRKLAAKQPEPVHDLGSLPIALAEKIFENTLQSIFYPSEQCLDFLLKWIGQAYAHAQITYSDPLKFCQLVQEGRPMLPEWSPPSLLIGHAGLGKTSLSETLQYVLPAPTELQTPDGTVWPLFSSWYVKFRDIKSENGFWRELGSEYSSTKDNIAYCRRFAFSRGISRLDLDELQFYTQSASANTAIAKLLLSAGNIGIPTNVTANFSLVRRLAKRDAPERQRLLSNVEVMLPDDPEGEDWKQFLQWQKNSLPSVLGFDPSRDADRINYLTGGQKRAEIRLLTIAYQEKRLRTTSSDIKIDLVDLELAYRSPLFQYFKDEIEEISRRAIFNVSKEDDLSCPVELPELAAQKFKQRAEQERNSRVAKVELQAALTAIEKSALKAIEMDQPNPAKSAEIKPIRPRKAKKSLAELVKNSARFAEQI